MINYYKILGVHDFASAGEIKMAYRKLSKKFHPDVNDGDKFFEELFKEIQNAYGILSNKNKKEIYDKELKKTLSNSNNFNFEKNKNKSENQDKEETKNTNTKTTASNQTSTKPQSESSILNFWSLSVFIIASIIIIIISNKIQEYSDIEHFNKDIEYFNNNQPTYKTQDLSSYDNQSPINDNEVNQAHFYSNTYFSIGSTKDEVLQVQGNPTEIDKYESIGEEVWSYEFSTVTFKNGKVNEYANTSENLKAKIIASNHSKNNANYFSIGSTKDEVLQVQGNPTEIDKYESMGEEVWSYGFSTVTFKNGKVNEYANTSENLKAKMIASKHNKNNVNYFSIGSTKNEVLQVQGNPTEINKYESMGEEVWSYGFSTVTFKNGKVNEYANTSGNLKVHL
jgi:curved DNA-binding protein CbpA